VLRKPLPMRCSKKHTLWFIPEIYLKQISSKKLLLSKLVKAIYSKIFCPSSASVIPRPSSIYAALATRSAMKSMKRLINRLRSAGRLCSVTSKSEKSFVVMRLPPFSSNPRREIGKHSKIYFLDLGIRNALIGDFNDLAIRPDRGAVWENFLIIERTKAHLNHNRRVQGRFWRTYGGAEVDYIEEVGASQIQAYEMKFTDSSLTRSAASFKSTYSVDVQLINPDNYLDFILFD
jgi:predicted AAA+ superfamily ATPase